MTPPTSIAEARALLDSGELTSVELTNECISIARETMSLRAFLSIDEDRALTAAARADAQRATGYEGGPLTGIPVAVKDCFRTRSMVTTYGCLALQSHTPVADDVVVARLRRAGSVILGKTNMAEMAIGSYALIGRARNPHDPSRTASGSSGGCAAAVASGSVYASVGTDAGGSLRLPAAYCGVTSLKPTHGRIPLPAKRSISWSLDHAGPVARSVADARVVTAVVSDATSAKHSLATDAPPRLGVIDLLDNALAPASAKVFESVLSRVADRGAALVPRAVDSLTQWQSPYAVTLLSEAAAAIEQQEIAVRESLSEAAMRVATLGAAVPAKAYLMAQQYRRRLTQATDEALEGVSALLMPSTPTTAPVTDFSIDDDGYWTEIQWLAPFNLTGHPAVTLPVPAAGLPTSIQLVGHRGADDGLLDTAEWLESALATSQ